MVFALGGAGYYFGQSPTKSTSESNVSMAHASMPWETGSTQGKYQYHPGGDKTQDPRDAPSAVNVVIVPDVNLPKVRCPPPPPPFRLGCCRVDRWQMLTAAPDRACTTSGTNGARMGTRFVGEVGECRGLEGNRLRL